jgi:hypothetical protein
MQISLCAPSQPQWPSPIWLQSQVKHFHQKPNQLLDQQLVDMLEDAYAFCTSFVAERMPEEEGSSLMEIDD